MTKTLAIPVFPHLQSLDAVGPGQVFGSANQVLERSAYRVMFVASQPGSIETSAGFSLHAASLRSTPPKSVHTLIIPGGEDAPIRHALRDKPLMRWINDTARQAKRTCSVCSGAFILASTGLLDGRTAATHWSATSDLKRNFPNLSVDENSIYVTDGKFWTSAGVTTGIDMSLALVEEDHGREIAMKVARQLVVYMRRPGHQTQFSTALNAQSASDDRIAGLASWIETHLHKRLDVETLAAQVAMSPRTFHRHLVNELGVSPARFVEAIRLDAARRWLDECNFDLASIAGRAGFSGADHLIRAFSRRFGVTPHAYRRVHGTLSS